MPRPTPVKAQNSIEEIDQIYDRFHKKMLAIKKEQDRLIHEALTNIEQARITHLKSKITTSSS